MYGFRLGLDLCAIPFRGASRSQMMDQKTGERLRAPLGMDFVFGGGAVRIDRKRCAAVRRCEVVRVVELELSHNSCGLRTSWLSSGRSVKRLASIST